MDRVIPLIGPVFGNGGLGEVVIYALFVEACLFVGSKVEGPTFVGESGVGVWCVIVKKMVGIDFCNVVGNDIVLGHGGQGMELGLIVLVAFDPYPFDFDWKSKKFGANVTKKIEVGLLRT